MGLKSLELSRGTFSTFELERFASQTGVVSPPRYCFQTLNARRIGTYATWFPSGAYEASQPHGRGIFSGKEPCRSTVNIETMPGLALSRFELNKIFLPSGDHPRTTSGEGCQVRRLGTPPSAGTV